MSLIVPPPLAILALPKNPWRNRNPINMEILFDNAHGIWVNVKIVNPTIYIGFRPNVSLNGARISGPDPKPKRKTDTENAANVWLVWKSSIICGNPGDYTISKSFETIGKLRAGVRGKVQTSSYTTDTETSSN